VLVLVWSANETWDMRDQVCKTFCRVLCRLLSLIIFPAESFMYQKSGTSFKEKILYLLGHFKLWQWSVKTLWFQIIF